MLVEFGEFLAALLRQAVYRDGKFRYTLDAPADISFEVRSGPGQPETLVLERAFGDTTFEITVRVKPAG